MGRHIQALLIALMVLAAAMAAAASEETTTLVYYIEHEDEQAEDFIEITLEIEVQSPSLVDAISSAGKVAQEIQETALSYCKEHTKKGKGDCKQAVEVGKFEIEPVYQIVRKQATFHTFTVTHEVAVKVFNPDNIGFLVDSFLKYPALTLKEFNWLPLNEEDAEEAAVKEGVEKGQQLCGQVGLSLVRIIDVEEIEEDQPVEEEQQQDEDAEEPAQVTIYRFEVECARSKKK